MTTTRSSRLNQRLAAVVLCAATLFSAGCAKDIPVFTPPSERSIASNEKAWPKNHYLTLGYHAVQDGVADQTFLAVRTDQLVAQLQWLRKNGYQAVSVDQILAAKNGGPELPVKAVLLTFDDGYKDFYTRVIPVLRSFNWPAVLAPVGSWVKTPPSQPVIFGDTPAPRDLFLNTQELREVAKSPLVEIGAHTFDSHKGSQGNPQGNLMPHMANHLYLPDLQRYETSDEFKKRVRDDVRAVSRTITETTGRKPRVWVWPYGRANGEALQVIREEGYELFLTLEVGLADVNKPDNVPRMLMTGRDNIESIASLMVDESPSPSIRVSHIDLDYLYDADPAQQAKNLDLLVQRIADLKINTVFLQAFSDPDGDGLVKEVYFPNSVLPMRADFFNRVAWQLTSRGGVRVYAWMPVLSLALDESYPRVARWNPENGELSVDPKQYQRLSPFNARNRDVIGKLYEDLARHASFAGVLYHDDALLSDFEDASPDAMAAYESAGLPKDIAKIRNDSNLMHQWTRFKSQALIQFTDELTEKVRNIRGPEVKTARNIFAAPILDPKAEQWFAQNPDDFLKAYDWTAPMAMPYMEGVPHKDASRWLDTLVDRIAERPGALQKTIFELQTRDWRQPGVHASSKDQLIDSSVIADWMHRLQLRGVKHYGYYPDDFTQDHPAIKTIRPHMSITWYPYP